MTKIIVLGNDDEILDLCQLPNCQVCFGIQREVPHMVDALKNVFECDVQLW